MKLQPEIGEAFLIKSYPESMQIFNLDFLKPPGFAILD